MKKEWNRLHPFILTDDKNPVAPLISLDEQFRTGPTHTSCVIYGYLLVLIIKCITYSLLLVVIIVGMRMLIQCLLMLFLSLIFLHSL